MVVTPVAYSPCPRQAAAGRGFLYHAASIDNKISRPADSCTADRRCDGADAGGTDHAEGLADQPRQDAEAVADDQGRLEDDAVAWAGTTFAPTKSEAPSRMPPSAVGQVALSAV